MTTWRLKCPESSPVEKLNAWLNDQKLEFKQLNLAKYPGCVHWHITKKGSKGTIEATWWPAQSEFWISVHANRASDWQEPVILAVQDLFS